MSNKINIRKHLSADSLIKQVKNIFYKMPDHRARNIQFSLSDVAMSAYAMFSIKCDSLLKFDEKRRNETEIENIKSIYKIENVPGDNQMRNILDEVDPKHLRPVFTKIFAQLQRGKILEQMTYFDDYYLLSLDGIEVYKSYNIFSGNCMSRKRSNGATEYYQQFLGAVITHPEKKEVIPLCPEMIIKQDGNNKNDCERNATKRFLKKFRNEHPHLKTIIVTDALGSNAPNVKELQKYNCKFIIGAKPKGNASLFDYAAKNIDKVTEFKYEEMISLNPAGQKRKKPKKIIHKFRFINNIPLNKTKQSPLVNFLDYWEYDEENEKPKHFSWITDIEITCESVYRLMKSGRSRWRIENETFNTLVNQGYNLKHNFGLGKKNLSTNFIFLMMLAFLVDQVQQLCCPLFQAVLKKKRRKKYLWEIVRSIFSILNVDSMGSLYQIILEPPEIS